jgi:hypothetical protein
LSSGQIRDRAIIKVNFQLVAIIHSQAGFGALHDRQTHVDGIPVKDAGEARRDDATDAAGLERDRRVFARRTAAEIRSGDDDVAGADEIDKILVDILHAVERQLGRIGRVQVARRDDHVGVDVGAIFKNFSFGLHTHFPLMPARTDRRYTP